MSAFDDWRGLAPEARGRVLRMLDETIIYVDDAAENLRGGPAGPDVVAAYHEERHELCVARDVLAFCARDDRSEYFEQAKAASELVAFLVKLGPEVKRSLREDVESLRMLPQGLPGILLRLLAEPVPNVVVDVNARVAKP